MEDRKSRLGFPLTQVLLIAMGVLVIYLTVDFGRQVITSQRRREELRAVDAKIKAVEARSSVLQDLLSWAQSDAAAEAWARSQGWAKPNEVPVVILAPTASTPSESQAAAARAKGSAANPQAWWDLFFGER